MDAQSTYVLLQLGAERYALPVEQVQEVVELERLTPVPGAPPATLGIHNLRGQILPVFDLGLILSVGGEYDNRQIVITDSEAGHLGFSVSVVSAVTDLPEARESVDSPFLQGAAWIDEYLVGIIDRELVIASIGHGDRGDG